MPDLTNLEMSKLSMCQQPARKSKAQANYFAGLDADSDDGEGPEEPGWPNAGSDESDRDEEDTLAAGQPKDDCFCATSIVC